ncbi:hypothetical protein [Halorussus sp. MSC15.2]|uniref:hypothetical protein n=1 Tax=Halorussus sp. MSC15.2 TaxID=2283638 RepID=UPI0013D8A42E|nr:hypothetical protein [Halorussus sp. MSC15.2]NEU56751.1 hypothetical protein [Halorussus sp. MSC15.2]
MKGLNRVREALAHPLAAASTVAGVFGIALHPGVLKAFVLALWQSAPTLFTISSIGAFTLPKILPKLELLKPVFMAALAVSGVLYLARLGKRTYQNFDNEL